MDRYCLVKLSIIYSYLYVVGHSVTCISYYGSRQIKDGEITVLSCPLYSVSKILLLLLWNNKHCTCAQVVSPATCSIFNRGSGLPCNICS